MIEYGVLNIQKIKKRNRDEKLEDEINKLCRKGWRVKCSVGSFIILVRQIEVK